jgi:hypothetical protein
MIFKVLAFCAGMAVAGGASAQAGEPGTQSGPPLAPGKPGETLSETLDRTDGVIKPPPADPQMQVTPPATDSNMPVLKPPPPQNSPRKPGEGG